MKTISDKILYLITEHFPNPYKPWVDTQIAGLIDLGTDVSIYAFGGWTTVLNDVVAEYELRSRTRYLPGTTTALLNSPGKVLRKLVEAPLLSARRLAIANREAGSIRSRPAFLARALMLPSQPPDAILVHDLIPASRVRFLRKVFPKTRLCLSYNGGEVANMGRVSDSASVFAGFDLVLALSEFARQDAIRRGAPGERVQVLPLGFDLSRFRSDAGRQYRSGGFLRLVSVGRLSPEKGIAYALKALQILKANGHSNIRYSIVGNGIEMQALKRESSELGILDMVSFVGEQPSQLVPSILAESDALLLPSLVTDTWAETQATVVQEALLMGCLTVTTPTGALCETNAPEMHRFFFPPADGAALAATIETLLCLSSEEWNRLGAAGRDFARRTFDARRTVSDLYEHLFSHDSIDSSFSTDAQASH